MATFGFMLALPASELKALPRLKTNLPFFFHNFVTPIEFSEVEIEAEHNEIIAEDLRAGNLTIRTENAPIKGHYNVSSSLTLTTSNAPIDVSIDAYHFTRHWASRVKLATSNARLDATLKLHNGTSIGLFHVNAKTSNSPLAVTVLESPLDAAVRVSATTSNAPARLELDAAFEGHFAAVTSNAVPAVNLKEGVEDPSGAGRERVVEQSYSSPKIAGGAVAWGVSPGKKHLKSSAGVSTSNHPVAIIL